MHPLTAVRILRGWTLGDVASLVQRRSGLNMACRREKVWRWEHGVTPERSAQYALADELGVARDEVATHPWPLWLARVDAIERVDEPWDAASAHDVLSQVVESAPMDRRGFLILSGSAVTGLALAWSQTRDGTLTQTLAGPVTPEVVSHLQDRVEQLWRLDDVLGGGSCLDAGVADLRLVADLIRRGRSSPEIRSQLYGLAAALARFCGWAAFDAGREAAAQRFWHAGLRSAAAAGDADQGVYVLSNLALQAAYAGDGQTAVALLDVARKRIDPAARTVLAMLDCWAARGHSVSGDAKTAARTLNRADRLWEDRRAGDDPDWIYWMPQPSLTVEAGTALLESGDLDAAERCLTSGLSRLDASSARDRNLYLVRLAEVRLRDGRLDEASATAQQAIDAAAEVDSGRVRARMAQLLDQFPDREPATGLLRDYQRDVE